MSHLSHCKVLLVDDTKTNIDVLIQALRNDYKLGVALNGFKAIEYAQTHQPDLILLDILMPGIDGFEVCERLKSDEKTGEIPIIFITAMDSSDHKTRGFEVGAVDYITKPFDSTEVRARVRTHLSLKIAQEALRNQNIILEEKVRERTRELEETQIEILNRLGMAAEYRDKQTGNHIRRVSEYCRLMGKAAGLSAKEYNMLALASTMHDVGKIGISDIILLKNGPLTKEERQIIETHTNIGADILSSSSRPLLNAAEVIARTHHEKWDGTGYPLGLTGEKIPLFGRIVAICDVFDALISERPYKKAWTVDEALGSIISEKGRHFDPELVGLFVGLKSELIEIIQEHTTEG